MSELEERVATITAKGQVTIPVEIRRLLGLEPGDRVVFRVREDAVEIESAAMTLEDAFGAVVPLNRPEDFSSLRDTAIEEHVRKTIEEMGN
jgi:AbrB family looped-hinge helix DNA binding protein